MPVLHTPHQRKSFAITVVLLLCIVFLAFNYGMAYLDPPKEYGVAINFGDVVIGKGTAAATPTKKSTTVATTPTEVTTTTVDKSTTDNAKTIVSNSETLPVSTSPKKTPQKTTAPSKKDAVQEVPTPSKATTDALKSLLSGAAQNGKAQGEGDDAQQGVKGTSSGSTNPTTFYGNTTAGNGNNYNLAGRAVLSTPKKQPDCQEEGTVVVRIVVNKQGKVIEAIPGVKGTTNTAACLLKPAKQAALETTWNTDATAPANQIGTIIYKFSLTK